MLTLFVSRCATGNNTCIYHNYAKTIIESTQNKVNSFCIDCFELEEQSYIQKWKSKLAMRFNSTILRAASWPKLESAPINSRLNVVVRFPAPFGLGQNGCWSCRGSHLPRVLPFIFSLCCPLNDRRRAAHSFFKIGRLFFSFSFLLPSLALLRLHILLLLLMSGNVHPNPGSIFPCSVCTGNVTWRGKSVQCCACSKWVHLRCSQLSLSQFRALGSSHSWSCPPAESL